jgi:16S rRNA (cytosine1402-N4)-methyltransferase
MDQDQELHRPVMADEVVDLLRWVPTGVVIDATFGGGGHSRRLLDELGPGYRILGIDRDPEALAAGKDLGEKVQMVHGNFADLANIAEQAGAEPCSGVLFDFGVSSVHLDRPERGFSYRQSGPLDMRMDPSSDRRAEDLVNHAPAMEVSRVIRRFGEEHAAERIARAIVAARPITDTLHLAEVVAAAAGHRRGHPARRTFQAIRIWVNDELDSVHRGLDAAIALLVPSGRCLAISYHSLEDRMVKRRFAQGATGCICPPDLPVCGCGLSAELRLLTRRPLMASEEEVSINRRARSARLRAAEKVAA